MQALFYFAMALLAAWLGIAMSGVRRKRPVFGTGIVLLLFAVAATLIVLGSTSLFGWP